MSTTSNNYLSRRSLLLIGSLLLVLLGFALRVHQLDGDSLWLDEMLTLRVVANGAEAMFNQNDHPPLFYALTWIPVTLAGESEFTARFMSLMAGTLSISLLIALGKATKQSGIGLLAAFLLVLSPFHIWYSQEARHYAVLMTFALLTFLSLYKALQKPTWRIWLVFALATVVNLYTHYGALLVLATQSVLIAVWMLVQMRRKQYRQWLYPITSAGLVAVCYLPWLPRLLLALSRNVNTEDVNHANRHVVPIMNWVANTFYAFGTNDGLLPYILLGLGCCGLVILAYQHKLLTLGIIITGLILPLLFIWLFQISRIPQPRYVIYMLPFFFLAVGVALEHGLNLLARWQWLQRVLFVLLVVGGGVVYRPLIANGYETRPDWRGIKNEFDARAVDNDFVVGFALDNPTGFNGVTISLPYYLNQSEHEYRLISGYRVDLKDAEALAAAPGNSWFVISRWGGIKVEGLPIQVRFFEPNLFFIHYPHAQGDALAQTIFLYELLIPMADDPLPACMLEQSLAVLYIADGAYEKAGEAVEQAVALCPDPPTQGESPAVLRAAVYKGLIQKYRQAGDEQLLRENAMNLWKIDRRNAMALEILTVENLLRRFADGDVQISNEAADAPAHVDRFEMPQNGDWGNVIFTHPPTAVSYQLNLPDQPVSLQTRLAMHPESWYWGGDGATFIVTIQPEGSAPVELLRQHVGNSEADQTWHPVSVSLAAYAGQPVTLTLQTEVGPAGDGTGDWAGWETPRLFWEVRQP